jgi:3-deoxy-D-manno-octulosonic acid (KDO) 8-phosphate synthase
LGEQVTAVEITRLRDWVHALQVPQGTRGHHGGAENYRLALRRAKSAERQ